MLLLVPLKEFSSSQIANLGITGLQMEKWKHVEKAKEHKV